MSYPSIVAILKEKGVTLEQVSESQARGLLWQAFQRDLSLGIAKLKELAEEALGHNKRMVHVEDPNSPLGKQLVRLLGADVARSICSEQMDVAFALGNCCVAVVAPKSDLLQLTAIEQIEFQNGVKASADC